VCSYQTRRSTRRSAAGTRPSRTSCRHPGGYRHWRGTRRRRATHSGHRRSSRPPAGCRGWDRRPTRTLGHTTNKLALRREHEDAVGPDAARLGPRARIRIAERTVTLVGTRALTHRHYDAATIRVAAGAHDWSATRPVDAAISTLPVPSDRPEQGAQVLDGGLESSTNFAWPVAGYVRVPK